MNADTYNPREIAPSIADRVEGAVKKMSGTAAGNGLNLDAFTTDFGQEAVSATIDKAREEGHKAVFRECSEPIVIRFNRDCAFLASLLTSFKVKYKGWTVTNWDELSNVASVVWQAGTNDLPDHLSRHVHDNPPIPPAYVKYPGYTGRIEQHAIILETEVPGVSVVIRSGKVSLPAAESVGFGVIIDTPDKAQ